MDFGAESGSLRHLQIMVRSPAANAAGNTKSLHQQIDKSSNKCPPETEGIFFAIFSNYNVCVNDKAIENSDDDWTYGLQSSFKYRLVSGRVEKSTIKDRGKRLPGCQTAKRTLMENRINLSPLPNSYLQHFSVAQLNLNSLIREERMLKRLQRSKQRIVKSR